VVFVIAVELHALLVLVELLLVVAVGVEAVVALMQEEAAMLVLLLVVHLDCLARMIGHVQCVATSTGLSGPNVIYVTPPSLVPMKVV